MNETDKAEDIKSYATISRESLRALCSFLTEHKILPSQIIGGVFLSRDGEYSVIIYR